MINVSQVTFPRTAIVTLSVSETDLAATRALLTSVNTDEGAFNPASAITVWQDVEFKSPNKGAQIVAIFEGMHADEIEFAERKDIAKAVNASPASVSTILTDAKNKGVAWALSYVAKDEAQGELARAKAKMAEFEKMMQKHPELADFFKAKFAAENAAESGAEGSADIDAA